MRPSIKSYRYLLVLLVLGFSFTLSAQAFSLGSSLVNFFSRTTNLINSRVSDLTHYLVMQKKYIFDNFSDPNTYTTWTVPDNFEQTITNLNNQSNSTSTRVVVATSTTVSARPIVVNTPVVPAPKPILSAPTVPINQTSISFPGLVSNSTSTLYNEPPAIISEPVSGRDTLILKYTNDERSRKSLEALVSNNILDKIAELRVEDLFANEYFEHESPDGQSAPDLAKDEGYEYILIGENLAMGNFAGDRGIVEAWMDSPGHRANILNSKYRELGVAQRDGTFKDRRVTIAVQIFARPQAACTKPSLNTQSLITKSSASIKELQAQAKVMYDSLENLKNNPATDKSYYNQKIQEYNYFAKSINDAVLNLKNLVDQYNLEVNQYNSCIYQ